MAKYKGKRKQLFQGFKIIQLPRRSGKTKALVQMVQSDPSGILVTNKTMIRYIPLPEDKKESIESLRFNPSKNYYIDEADSLFSSRWTDPLTLKNLFYMRKVRAVSFTYCSSDFKNFLLKFKTRRRNERTKNYER